MNSSPELVYQELSTKRPLVQFRNQRSHSTSTCLQQLRVFRTSYQLKQHVH